MHDTSSQSFHTTVRGIIYEPLLHNKDCMLCILTSQQSWCWCSLCLHIPLWERNGHFQLLGLQGDTSVAALISVIHLEDQHPQLYRMGKWLHAWRTWTYVWCQVYGSWVTTFWGDNGHSPELALHELKQQSALVWNFTTFHFITGTCITDNQDFFTVSFIFLRYPSEN